MGRRCGNSDDPTTERIYLYFTPKTAKKQVVFGGIKVTMDEYRREHDDREAPPLHCCDYCGEVIEPGWPGFEGDGQNRGVYLHKECVTEWVVREYDDERLALEIGFDKLPEVIL